MRRRDVTKPEWRGRGARRTDFLSFIGDEGRRFGMHCALRRSLIQLFIFSLAVTCCAALVGAADQDNAAGAAASPRRGETTVPSLSGLSAKQAKAEFQAAGLVAEFQVGSVAQKPDDAFKVYEVQPRQGTRLAAGSS